MAAKIGSGGGSGCSPDGAAAGSPDEAAAKSGAGSAGGATAFAAIETESPESHARRVIESCLACAMDLSSVAGLGPSRWCKHCGGPLCVAPKALHGRFHYVKPEA